LANFAITGGAGYIGSNIAISLLKSNNFVKILDKEHIENQSALRPFLDHPNLTSTQIDVTCTEKLIPELVKIDAVFHFSASADIALGRENPELDLHDGTIATSSVLESMRKNNIKKIIFPSSSTIYGYPKNIPTSEDNGPYFPTSLYGASKLASEGLISAYCYLYDFQSWIFRFGNIIGKNVKRGVIIELLKKLEKNSSELEVLGDGSQIKDYIYINDCVNAILYAFKNSNKKINYFNLSTGEQLSVKDLVNLLLTTLELQNTKLNYTGGAPGWNGGGWPGDVNKVHYDISKILSLGWKPELTSKEAVKLAIKDLINNNKVD
jgi:UDP-glucose 4-epimerase